MLVLTGIIQQALRKQTSKPAGEHPEETTSEEEEEEEEEEGESGFTTAMTEPFKTKKGKSSDHEGYCWS